MDDQPFKPEIALPPSGCALSFPPRKANHEHGAFLEISSLAGSADRAVSLSVYSVASSKAGEKRVC